MQWRHFVNRCWTLSIEFMSCFKWGDQTIELYSTSGQTYTKKALMKDYEGKVSALQIGWSWEQGSDQPFSRALSAILNLVGDRAAHAVYDHSRSCCTCQCHRQMPSGINQHLASRNSVDCNLLLLLTAVHTDCLVGSLTTLFRLCV